MSYQFPVTIYMPTQTAGADADHDIALPDVKTRIVAAKFAPAAASAANATNYATLTIESHDGAGGSVSAHSAGMTTATVAMAVGTTREFTITADTLPAGGSLRLAKTYAASGVAVAGVLTVVLQAVI